MAAQAKCHWRKSDLYREQFCRSESADPGPGTSFVFKAQIKSNSGNFLACVSGISPAAWIEEVQMV